MDHQFHNESGKTESILFEGLSCPICSRAIQANTKFCAHCSAAILRRYCGACTRLVPDATSKCPYCGASAKISLRPHRLNGSFIRPALLILAVFTLWMLGMKSSGGPPPSSPETLLAKIPSAAPTQPVIAKQDAMPVSPQIATQPIQGTSVQEGIRLNLAGHALLKERRFAEAIPLLQQAVSNLKGTGAPEYPYALFNLAQATRMSGNPREAVPLLEECLKIIPNQELARNELMRTYQILGSPRTAQ